MRRREFITLLGGATAVAPIFAWPFVARAQQQPVPVVGFLRNTPAGDSEYLETAFRRGLEETGFGEDRNVVIEHRWPENQNDRLPGLAADLVRRGVAVIAAAGAPAAMAAKAATTTIPIVFLTGTEPVQTGLVASLNRPGGNLTGTYFFARALEAKRLELLHEIVPAATSIAYLVNPNFLPTQAEMKEVEVAARILGVRVMILNASGPSEIEAAFATLVQQRAGALLVASDPFFLGQRDLLAELASRLAVPAIYHDRQLVEAGGLMSYGARIVDVYRLLGVYTGRILKGEKPAGMPVQQSTKIELVVNLKTATALGIAVPLALRARADEVIE